MCNFADLKIPQVGHLLPDRRYFRWRTKNCGIEEGFMSAQVRFKAILQAKKTKKY